MVRTVVMVSLIHDGVVMMIYVSSTVEALTKWTQMVRSYRQVLIVWMKVSFT